MSTETFFIHLLIGGAGAAAGWVGVRWCRHLLHQLVITGLIVMAEAIVFSMVEGVH